MSEESKKKRASKKTGKKASGKTKSSKKSGKRKGGDSEDAPAKRQRKGKSPKFVEYEDTYAFSGGPFSNWTKSPFDFDLKAMFTEGKESDMRHWECAEQLIMALKALVFGDEASYNKIVNETSPFKIKQLGRKVKGYSTEVWDAALQKFMPAPLMPKYEQHKESKEALLATGTKRIVEASKKDKRWGVGLAPDNPDVCDPNKHKGTNWLGKWLEAVRAKLQPAG